MIFFWFSFGAAAAVDLNVIKLDRKSVLCSYVSGAAILFAIDMAALETQMEQE